MQNYPIGRSAVRAHMGELKPPGVAPNPPLGFGVIYWRRQSLGHPDEFTLPSPCQLKKKARGVATRRTRQDRWEWVASWSRRLLPTSFPGPPAPSVSPINVIRVDIFTPLRCIPSGTPYYASLVGGAGRRNIGEVDQHISRESK